MRLPRNAGLMTTLKIYREFKSGTIDAERAFQMLIFAELEPKERLVLHYVTEHPDATAAQVAEYEAMSHVHAGTVLKRLTDLGLLEREEFLDYAGKFFVYRLKKL